MGLFGFLKFFEDSTLHGTLGKSLLEKIAPKHGQNTFAHFWECFGFFWHFQNFSIFFNFFEGPTLHGTRGILFFWKIATQHVRKKFAQFSVRSWAFLRFWIFLISRKLSMNPWNTEQKNFSKKTAPSYVWTLGNDFGHFWNFERFLIFFMNFF